MDVLWLPLPVSQVQYAKHEDDGQVTLVVNDGTPVSIPERFARDAKTLLEIPNWGDVCFDAKFCSAAG